MNNLKEKQIAALGKMISIEKNTDAASSIENFVDLWKVLIYDEDCRDIISPLMNVSSLRQKGVTLHLLLNSEREPITDAPAAYFVRPTEENIMRIADDCSKRLYRSFYLHFVTRIERPMLEKLAKELVASNSMSLIAKVYDQYLDLIALEPGLFTLNIKDSFIAYNDPTLSEIQIKSFINRMAYGLLSMIRLSGTLPIIRAPPGGAAEMLAQELCGLIREHTSTRGPAMTLFADCLNADPRSRPLLVIFDRTSDMSPPLIHTSTYQALIDDLLEHKLNRVAIDPTDKFKTTTTTTTSKNKVYYDLNVTSDAFYSQYSSAPIPEAVEANVKDLEEVTKIESDLRTRPTDRQVTGPVGEDGKTLHDVLENLPEILARKKTVETHTNILGALMTKIKAREIPAYFELEQSILSIGRVVDKSVALALLRDGTKGSLLDKARFLSLIVIVTYCGSESVPPASALKTLNEEYDSAFTYGCTSMTEQTPSQTEITRALAAVTFLRRTVSLQGNSLNRRVGSTTLAAGGLQSFLTSAQTKIKSAAASWFAKFVALWITKVVDNLTEGRGSVEVETFVYFDPKLRAGEQPSVDAKSQKYTDVMVFAVGGGCYSEMNNLQELLKQKQASGSASALRSVVYGASEIFSGDSFYRQLDKLATPIPISSATPTSATTTNTNS